MADIFISYASNDRERVRPLVSAFEAEGWSVWWDRSLIVGDAWDDRIEQEVASAKCIVVIWTESSIGSQWVKSEAMEGFERDILTPILMDPVQIPFPFRRTHTVELTDAGRALEAADLAQCFARVAQLVGSGDSSVTPERKSRSGHATDRNSVGPSKRANANYQPRVLVLPYADRSQGEAGELLADGMTEEVITMLSQAPALIVLTRAVSLDHSGVDLKSISAGDIHGADYLVEGSVRRRGKKLRISTRLVDAISRAQLWADRYDCAESEIFDVQDQIGLSICRELGTHVRIATHQRVRRQQPDNLDAWGLVTKASLFGIARRSALKEQLPLLERAIDLEPEYALALAQRALVLAQYRLSGALSFDEQSRHRVITDVEKALSISPLDCEVLHRCVRALSWIREAERAEELARKACALAPESGFRFGLETALLANGKPEETMIELEASWSDNPTDLRAAATLGAQACNILGRYEDAVVWSRRGLESESERYDPWLYMANALAKLGQTGEAQDAVQNARRLAPGMSFERWHLLWERIYPNASMADRLMDGLKTLDFSQPSSPTAH